MVKDYRVCCEDEWQVGIVAMMVGLRAEAHMLHTMFVIKGTGMFCRI